MYHIFNRLGITGEHILVYLLDLALPTSFMQVVYCQPTDNNMENSLSELANAEVIIKPEDNQTSQVKVSLNREENKVNVVANVDTDQIKTAISHLGAGTAAGYVGAAVVKSMQSSSIPAKVAIGAGVTGATFILGSKAADVAISNVIKNEATATLKKEPVTPTEPNNEFSASSLLDSVESDIPLISMVNILLEFNYMELILLLVLIFLVLKQRFKIGTRILTFSKNRIPQNQVKIHNLMDKLITGNDQVDQLLIITYLFLMLMVKSVLLYFMLDLKLNIDAYVNVYNKIKGIIS